MNNNTVSTKFISILTFFLIGLFFFQKLISSLVVGGRWDLNEHIAFADRIAEGVIKYSNGVTDLFVPSSPYFPGVGYLSYIYQKLGIEDTFLNNQLLLVTAVAVGLLYFILLNKLTIKLYPNISTVMIYFISTIFLLTHFKSYIGYMIEFKPDTILLLIGMTILFLIEKNKKISILDIFLIGFLLFISVYFKQSFFLIFFLTFILITLNKFLSIREKIYIQVLFSIIGIIALYMVLNIENLYIFTIETMGKHPIIIKDFIVFCYMTVLDNSIFVFFLCIYLFSRYKNLKIISLETKYLLFSLFWLAFSFLSAAKLGGNTGNTEVGIFVLLPFAIFAVDRTIKEFYSIFLFRLSLIFVLFVGIIGFMFLSFNQINKYQEKLNHFSQSYLYLNENFKNKKALIDGNTYVLAKKSGLKILTESETIGNFNNIPNYDMSNIKNAFHNQVYDIIFIENYFTYFVDKEIHEIFKNKYQILIDDSMPSYLNNKLYIKKED